MGTSLCIDETSLSNGEVYTIVTNSDAGCKKGALVAIIKGTKSVDVIVYLKKINKKLRDTVECITMDLSDTMALIAIKSFPNAIHVIDRFHVQKLINEVVQSVRVKYRWEAQKIEDEMCEKKYESYKTIFPNGETIAQLFIRSRYSLFKSRKDWTDSVKERMSVLFNHFPEIEIAYEISEKFKFIMNATRDKVLMKAVYNKYLHNKRNNKNDEIRNAPEYSTEQYRVMWCKMQLIKWYNDVEKNDTEGYFKSVLKTFSRKSTEIIRYCIQWKSNSYAEAFNAKIKAFRARVKGIKDIRFFLFRLTKLFA